MTQCTPDNRLTIESLWQFSLQYYSMREIKEACLSLQNQFHGNVNLLLALKWLDEHQLSFSHQDWPQIMQSLGRTESFLLHFRELRRKTKPHLPDSLYRESLQFELQLERQQQADIVDTIHQLTLTHADNPHLTDDYCHRLGAEHLAMAFNRQLT